MQDFLNLCCTGNCPEARFDRDLNAYVIEHAEKLERVVLTDEQALRFARWVCERERDPLADEAIELQPRFSREADTKP